MHAIPKPRRCTHNKPHLPDLDEGLLPMTLRAPYETLHGHACKRQSFEREVLLETLGACWALSARNVSGQFALHLQIDLSRVQLLYGVPAVQLPERLLLDLMRVFQHRPAHSAQSTQAMERNALALVDNMDEADFLNFSTGFHDTVKQILHHQAWWNTECIQANMALKYHSMNLIESGMHSSKIKRTYADLLCAYLANTQRVFLQEIKASPMHW